MPVSDFDQANWEANELIQEAHKTFQALEESKAILGRRQFDYAYPYFTLFGLVIILTYTSGQYLSSDVVWLVCGASWGLLGPLCSVIAYRWYRREQCRDGVVALYRPVLNQWRFYLLGAALIGTVLTLLLSNLNLSDYVFPAWVLVISGVYISWGSQLDWRLLGLGLVNLVITLAVMIWWLDACYLILGLVMGGGNLLLGITARQRLVWQRRQYQLRAG